MLHIEKLFKKDRNQLDQGNCTVNVDIDIYIKEEEESHEKHTTSTSTVGG